MVRKALIMFISIHRDKKQDFTLYNPTRVKNINIWTRFDTRKRYIYENTFRLIAEIPQLSLCLLYKDLPCDRISVKTAVQQIEKMFDQNI